MKIVRIAIASMLTLVLSGLPAVAGDLSDSVAAAAGAEAARADAQEAGMKRTGGKAMVVGGSALFVGGMTYGLFSFINNKNGGYSEFGEYKATSAKGGAMGLSLAFAGGLMMLAGKHAASAPSVTFAKKGVQLSKHVAW